MASDASAALQELTKLGGRHMTLQRALVQKLAEDAIAADPKDLLAALRFFSQLLEVNNAVAVDPRTLDDEIFIQQLASGETVDE